MQKKKKIKSDIVSAFIGCGIVVPKPWTQSFVLVR